ncbi:hypothetical protein EAO01_18665 [Klebsiella pneumoniae]|nr:hypothetical protein EAO01_18665 [Klebsiella pneumoniae]
MDRVRVRFAKQLDKETWGFEDPSIKGTFVWSRSAGQGKFEWGSSQTTVHDGSAGGSTTPPTPIPEPRSIWGCLTRPRNRYRPYRERRSRRNRNQILKHCPSKTGISMTLLLLTRWGVSRQSMFIFRKLQLEI